MDRNVASGWRERGRACIDEKRYDDALAIYDAVLAEPPDAEEERDAWIQKSAALLGLHRDEEALEASDHALALAPDSAAAWTSKARLLGCLERYDEALAACSRAIELDPGYAASWIVKGTALSDLKRLDDALEAFDHARSLNPSDARVWYDVGLTLLYLNRYNEALAAFDGALSASDGLTSERTSGVWNDKGVTLDHLERYAEALNAYEHALALDPDYAPSWDNKGTALVSLERYEDALDAYDHALSLDPNFAQAWNNKGHALASLERYDEALTAFERALALDPVHEEWWIDCAEALLDLGRNSEALDAAKRAQEIDPDSATALQYVCRALGLLGRDDDVVRVVDDYLARNNADGAAWYVRAVALTRLERREEAMEALDRGLERDTALADHWATWRLKGDLHRAAKQYEQAAEAYQRAVDFDPEDEDTWAALGSELTRFGRWEEALAAFDRALTLDPDHLWSSERRAASLFHLGRWEEALAAYERAIALQPSDADLLYWKGIVLQQLGRYEEALTALDEALKLAPKNDRIQVSRDSLLPWMRRTVTDQRMRLRDGRELGYLDFGDPNGAPIFYFHGLPGSRLDMVLNESLLKELGIRLIAPDRPGYGISTYQAHRAILDWPNDVLALADHLGIHRFAVLGVSGGGAYALACCYKIPERLRACGLVSSIAPPEAFKGSFEWTPAYVSHQVARYSPQLALRALSAWLSHTALENADSTANMYRWRNERMTVGQMLRGGAASSAPSLSPTMREIIAEPFHHGGRGYARDSWLIARAWGFPLADVIFPVHLWHGEKDFLAPASLARYLTAHISNCDTTYYPDERHDVLYSHGREILTTLRIASGEAGEKTT